MSDTDPQPLILDAENLTGIRLDKALSDRLPEHTRSTIQQWIKQGLVLVNGKAAPQKYRLTGSETLEVQVPEPEAIEWTPTQMELDIVYEDAHLIAVNKPPGLVVHPGAGNIDNTLLNGLVYYAPELAILPRAGIVHRLDKDTSGLMVVSKSELARQHLIRQLESREMQREYVAVANGVMISGETIDQPIGRSSQNRLLMAITQSGKSAVTHFRVLEKFRCHSLLQANLDTGRTHQIRVHLSWRGFPIVGDRQYCRHPSIPPGSADNLIKLIQQFPRQALHARKLTLTHPVTGETLSWTSAIPEDIDTLINALREDHNGYVKSD